MECIWISLSFQSKWPPQYNSEVTCHWPARTGATRESDFKGEKLNLLEEHGLSCRCHATTSHWMFHFGFFWYEMRQKGCDVDGHEKKLKGWVLVGLLWALFDAAWAPYVSLDSSQKGRDREAASTRQSHNEQWTNLPATQWLSSQNLHMNLWSKYTKKVHLQAMSAYDRIQKRIL